MSIILVFASTLRFEFVNFDDYDHLHKNPSVVDFNLERLPKIWTEPHFGLYIPVTYTLWGLEFRFAKWLADLDEDPLSLPSPFIFHGTNVLFHTFNALLVYWLLLQLSLGISAAVIGALIFALHPVQVESVAWISSFRDLLAAFWGLLFLNFTLKTFRDPSALTKGPRTMEGLSLTVLLILAILSKPTAVIFTVFAPLLLYLQEWRPQRRGLGIVNMWFFLWLCLTCTFTAIAKQIQYDANVDLNPQLWERILLSFHSLTFYARSILWPSQLSPDYGLNPAYLLNMWHATGWPIFTTALSAVLVSAVSGLAWRRHPWAMGLLLAILGLAPYLGLLSFNFQNVSLVADRYLYLPMIGMSFCFASLPLIPRKKPLGPLKLSSISILLVMLAIASYQQCAYWRTNEVLYKRMTQLNARSFYGYSGLGGIALLKGENTLAIDLLRKAVELRSSYPPARYNLARALETQGKYLEALQNYVQVINIDPSFIEAYRDLANLLLLQGRLTEAKETVEHALQRDPSSVDLHSLKEEIMNANQKARTNDK
jgi:tetratricopeptide (TPR) repeat protein